MDHDAKNSQCSYFFFFILYTHKIITDVVTIMSRQTKIIYADSNINQLSLY